MNFNQKLDSLLNVLDPAHKIILNEKNITLVRLHDNEHFYTWLQTSNILPTLKPYHNPANFKKSVNFKLSQNSNVPVTSDSLFITMAIIPNIKQPFNITCCSEDIDKLANRMFHDIESSGLIFNGSYFYLDRHVREKVYNIDTRKDIYDNAVSSEDESVKSYLEKPIGFFNYDRTRLGEYADKKYKDKTYKNIYDGKSLEKGYKVKKYNTSPPYESYNNDSYLTLQIIADALGIVFFPKEGGMSIKKLLDVVDYKTNTPEITDPAIKNENMVMGNLLVYDNNIILNEEKMSVAIVLFSIAEINIKMYDRIYLCNDKFEKLSGNDVTNLATDSHVFFISYDEPDNVLKRGSIIFNSKNLYLPYSIDFIKKEFPTNFAGRIPPGYLNHASDLNPRTCIMNDENGNVIVMHIEGRQKICGGIGIDLFDLAKLCHGLGAQHAINLDGGQSSKLTWKEKFNPINTVGAINYKISNAIFVQ